MEYIEHVTADGERWDSLSYRYYGSVELMEVITRANPEVALTPILPAGLTLKIPVLILDNAIAAEELPPWKR